MTDDEFDVMLKTIASRPRMYCCTIETGRDLVLFLRGVCCGAIYPALGRKFKDDEDTPAFRDYVYRRFNREPPRWGYWQEGEMARLLLEEYGDKPITEVSEAIGNIFRGVRDVDISDRPTR